VTVWKEEVEAEQRKMQVAMSELDTSLNTAREQISTLESHVREREREREQREGGAERDKFVVRLAGAPPLLADVLGRGGSGRADNVTVMLDRHFAERLLAEDPIVPAALVGASALGEGGRGGAERGGGVANVE